MFEPNSPSRELMAGERDDKSALQAALVQGRICPPERFIPLYRANQKAFRGHPAKLSRSKPQKLVHSLSPEQRPEDNDVGCETARP